jgi:PAB1-binding protein PBP1
MHADVQTRAELERDKKKAPGARGGFATDTEISGARGGGERQLERFAFDGDLDASLSLDSKGGGSGSWDQFAVNKQKFGVVSNFEEATYTTVLDKYRE